MAPLTDFIAAHMIDLRGRKTWAAVPKEDVNGILSGKYSDAVEIPPDHKVVVIQPSPTSYFRQSASGMWIAELGSGTSLEAIIAQARQVSTTTERMTILWILQPIILDSSTIFEAVVSGLAAMLSESGDRIVHLAVVPYATDRHLPMMRQLKDLGLAVHYSGPNGECLVEVHKPEGIVAGMPGRAFTG